MLVDRISQGMHAHRCLLEKMKPALVVGSSAQSVSALACCVKTKENVSECCRTVKERTIIQAALNDIAILVDESIASA